MTESSKDQARLLQQQYYELFGDRDWDRYYESEYILLKRMIGFALFGDASSLPSENETGYERKQNDQINLIFGQIRKNQYPPNSNSIIIRIIFIVYVVKEKKESVLRTPVFVVKKCNKEVTEYGCVDSSSLCKTFIDNLGRVYKSWSSYLKNNKLPKCMMYCPKNGWYSANMIKKVDEFSGEDEDQNYDLQVKLQFVESPACGIGKKILDTTDKAGTVLSVGTTGIMAVSLIPAITVAPALLAGAVMTGIGLGAYTIGRSIHTLVERRSRDQSISINDAESRACWINTSVGLMGIGTSAATGLMTKAVSNGTNISRGLQLAFNTLNVANMAGSSVGLLCSLYNIVDKVRNNETITPLEVYQFATSVLFFYKSVADFRFAKTIISETQTATLTDYEALLRSNRHRKLFRKAQKESRRINGETAGNAEIISGIRKINDPDNFFAGLARINKDMNKNNARFIINSDGKITINSNHIIDPMEFSSLTSTERANLLSTLPPPQTTSITQKEFNVTKANVTESLQKKMQNQTVKMTINITKDLLECENAERLLQIILQKFTSNVAEMFIDILVELLEVIFEIFKKEFKQLFPKVAFSIGVLQFIIEIVKAISSARNLPLDKYLKTCFDKDGNIQIDFINMLKDKFTKWIQTKISDMNDKQKLMETEDTNTEHIRRIDCDVCIGFYFICVERQRT